MFIDGTLPEKQYAKNFMRFAYLLQNLCLNHLSENVLSFQQKPIMSPVYLAIVLFLLFSKKIYHNLKKSFQFMIDFNYEALWRPFCHELAPQPEFLEKSQFAL